MTRLTPRGAIGPWLLMALVLLITACSDSSDDSQPAPRDWSLAQMQALLPDQVEATLALDALALSDPEGLPALLDASRVAEPAIVAVAAQLLALTSGFEAGAEIRRLLLTRPGGNTAAYLLLADTHTNTLAELYGEEALETISRYRGIELFQHPELEMAVGMLPGALLAVAQERALRDLIDRLRDDAPAPGSAPAPGAMPIVFHLQLADYSDQQRALSLRQASTFNGSLDLVNGKLQGEMRFRHPAAPDYIDAFKRLSEGTATPALAGSGDSHIVLPVTLPLTSTADRSFIRQLFQGFDGVSYAQGAGVDGNPAWLNFNVGVDPNSIFINFEFADATQRERFEADILPAGFRLAPLRILADETPGYFLVLNIYQSSGGLVEGARAEWSVFVEDPLSGEPRFLVVQAAAESISADPVNLLTLPEPVSHELDGGAVRSYVGEVDEDGGESVYFRSNFPYPISRPQLRPFAREFVAANDFIYWGNGVADRGVFNGSVFARQAELIPLATLELDDRSRWAAFVDAQPRHALIYRNPLDIIISPWSNLRADYLDVTPAQRRELVNFSDAFYPMTALTAAEQAFRGERSVVSPAVEGADGPTLYLHFAITDPQGLGAAIGLRDTEQLAALALAQDITAQPVLSLHVFRRSDDDCGWRAQWLVYTQIPGETAASTRRLRQHAAQPCLDADRLLTGGELVDMAQQGSQLELNLEDLGYAVRASLDSTLVAEQQPALGWLAALDSVCSIATGICDKRFIDGQTLKQPVLQVDPSGIELTQLRGPWSAFIEREVLAAWLVPQPRLIVTNPWDNAAVDQAGPAQ